MHHTLCRHNAARCAFALVLAIALPAQAARPLITDDARTVDAGACQVESFQRSNHDNREAAILPACNFWLDTEVTLGGTRTLFDDGARSRINVIQAKHVFRETRADQIGIAMTAGTLRRPGTGKADEWYVNIPITWALGDSGHSVHLNLGHANNRALGQTRSTWGLGSEWFVNARVTLIAEAFGDDRVSPSAQAGLRFWIVPNHFQIDATAGAQRGEGRDGRFVSIGLRILTDKLLH